MQGESLPPISELSQPELRLAGIRINPHRFGPSRAGYFRKVTLQEIADGKERAINGFPSQARILRASWSADSRYLAFFVVEGEQIRLWIGDSARGQAQPIKAVRLNATLSPWPCKWVSNRHELICLTVPNVLGMPPRAPSVPGGPVIQQTSGGKAAARTYQDLLKNAHDENLFEYYATSQVVRVTLNGEVQGLGEPGLHTNAEPSPDGTYVLVEEVRRPFSRLVPAYRFARRARVWDRNGKTLRQLADLPPAEQVPIGRDAVPTGPRNFGWREDTAATIHWTEARDGGDPGRKAEIRDEVLTLAVPFTGDAKLLFSGSLRVRGINWGSERLALVSEYWWKTRQVKVWNVRPDGDAKPRVLFDRKFEDRYSDPGYPVMRRNKQGGRIIQTTDDGSALLYAGLGASPDGDRPFLDKRNLASGEVKRLWRSQAPFFETPVGPLDDDGLVVLTPPRERQPATELLCAPCQNWKTPPDHEVPAPLTATL